MRYETVQGKILNKWRYQAKYNLYYTVTYKYVKGSGKVKQEKWRNEKEADYIAAIDLFLKYKSTGEWARFGNSVYVSTIGDIFNLRIFFEEGLLFIREGC